MVLYIFYAQIGIEVEKKDKMLKSDLRHSYKISWPKIKFLNGSTDLFRLDLGHMTINVFIVSVSTFMRCC